MKNNQAISGYRYAGSENSHAHSFLMPSVRSELAKLKIGLETPCLFDLGCGNGSVAALLQNDGWQVTGVDPSTEGIAAAKVAYPALNLEEGSAYDDLVESYGRFPVVLSLEVVEHVYAPRDYARTLFDLVEPGGTAIISTPYHGYWKNLALAVSGKLDRHFTALWDHGHIKFWSMETLTSLLNEAGFRDVRFRRVGRIPPLAKAMIAIARKP
jgi:2-polyprenyl-3-methyl-5-hydroxy-6-metoxy-1,4-benzoquinol methylase